MKIGLAQTAPSRGDIAANVDDHLAYVDIAAALGAELIVFPELSLTGYHPSLAAELAITPDDPRLAPLQARADAAELIIAAGAPTRSSAGVHISLIVFAPESPRRVMSKAHIHADEEPFFAPGRGGENILHPPGGAERIALAICYELSIPAHADQAIRDGARCYVASVAKDEAGVVKAHVRMAEIAVAGELPVLFANSVGPAEGFVNAGQSAGWNAAGVRQGELNNHASGVLIYDSHSGEVSTARLQRRA